MEQRKEQTQVRSVTLDIGTIHGLIIESRDGVEIETYKGIPFAKFDKRFDNAYLYQDPLGSFNAFEFGPHSHQSWFDYRPLTNEYDCLNLDVWTPNSTPDKLMPVYVFIHGGANTFDGSCSPYYQLGNLADDGIVCVSLNYRLGAHGFSTFRLDNGTIIANQGLSDLIVGLEWVKKYVSAFGGDPDQITVGGQSSGGFNTCYLMNSPKAKGMFSRGILQSGGDLGVDLDEAIRITMEYAAHFSGKEVTSSQEAYEILSAADSYTLARRYTYLDGDPNAFYIFNAYPVRDGVYLAANPLENLRSENCNRVDILVGQTANEAAMYTHGYYKIRLGFFDFLARSYCSKECIPKLREYFNLREQSSTEELRTAIRDFGEISFIYDAYLTADAMADAGKNVYMYLFSYGKERVNEGYSYDVDMTLPPDAAHSSELGIVYQNCTCELDAAGNVLLEQMHKAWVNFIKCGDPNGKNNSKLAVAWPKYDRAAKALVDFDSEISVRSLADTRIMPMLKKVLNMMYGYKF